jgi:hypothetical protein
MKRTIPTHQHKSFHATYFITTLLLSGFMCLSTACNKDDDGPDNPYGLPNATETGANTFGCLINGNAWIAEANGLGLQDISATYDEVGVGVADQYYFNVSATYFPSATFPPPDSAISDIFSMNIKPIFSEGGLDFPQLLRKDATYYTELMNINNTLKVYKLDTLYSNYLHVTNLDTIKNICSAKFNLRLIRTSNLLDTILVTDGRFDVIYQPD